MAYLSNILAKSMAFFVTVEEWKGYKRGVEDADAVLSSLGGFTFATPSTDFTEVHESPYKDYLLFDRHEEEWFVGWYDRRKDKFLWTAHSLDGDEYLSPSHWLPLPNNPLTDSENE